MSTSTTYVCFMLWLRIQHVNTVTLGLRFYMRLYLISWFDDGEGGLHGTVFEGDQCAIILQPVVPLFYYLN